MFVGKARCDNCGKSLITIPEIWKDPDTNLQMCSQKCADEVN